jgi:hypothetical protein
VRDAVSVFFSKSLCATGSRNGIYKMADGNQYEEEFVQHSQKEVLALMKKMTKDLDNFEERLHMLRNLQIVHGPDVSTDMVNLRCSLLATKDLFEIVGMAITGSD